MENHSFNFPAEIELDKDSVSYIEVTQSELDHLAFHDTRLNQHKKISYKKKLSEQVNNNQNLNVSFIFHTAFCGSTFLSRLIGQVKGFNSIREPNVFMQLANEKRINDNLKNNPQKINSITYDVLSSFFRNKSKLIFKPTNATNNIITELLNADKSTRGIMLYTSLKAFIISILKKGEAGKSFIRNLYNIFSLDSSPFAMTDFRQVNQFTDLQIACLVWAMQMYEYQKFYYRNDQVKFLNSEDLFNQPEKTLTAVAGYFGQEISGEDMKKLMEKGLFSSHSKYKGQRYNSSIRKNENNNILKKYQFEFEEILEWQSKFLKLPPLPSENIHIKL